MAITNPKKLLYHGVLCVLLKITSIQCEQVTTTHQTYPKGKNITLTISVILCSTPQVFKAWVL